MVEEVHFPTTRAKVVSLGPVEITENGGYPGVVAFVESLLEEAKRGEIESLAIVKARPSGKIATDYTASMNVFGLVAGAFTIQFDLTKESS